MVGPVSEADFECGARSDCIRYGGDRARAIDGTGSPLPLFGLHGLRCPVGFGAIFEKLAMTKKPPRVPTAEEFSAYEGAHCFQLWKSLARDWTCPACRRTKYQIMRWTMRFPRTPKRFEGWMAGLHQHHDHARSWTGVGIARFEPIVICDQCNSADGTMKRHLGLPPNFSFTPTEIGQFIIATPHGPHKLDFVAGRRVYLSLKASASPAK